MEKFSYIIIGGGMTAYAAVDGIRAVDSDGSIALFTAENSPPYDRPPLSKGLWTDDSSRDEIVHSVEKKDNLTLFSDCLVDKILPDKRQILAHDGTAYGYKSLLLATGGSAKQLPFDEQGQIIYYRTIDDYDTLQKLVQKYDNFAVIGAGFIGSEISAALTMNDKQVTMIFPSDGVCSGLFSEETASYLNDVYKKRGIRIHSNTKVTGLSGKQGDFTLHTDDGPEIQADIVIAGIGIEPNVALAEAAGLDVEDGIKVDESLRTSDSNIWAAGDVANFFDHMLEKRRRVEHADNALSMGEAAGRSMAGEKTSYDYSPKYSSDLFDISYEAVGELDSSMRTIVDWDKKFERGVIYYLDGDQIRGVLLWNVQDKIEEARELIQKAEHLQPENIRGLIGDWENYDLLLKETFPASDPPGTW